jgi:hypothetical protein
MVAEVYAGLSAFKTLFDMAKGLKDINDATVRNGAIIELQEKILAAREAQSAALERIGELEKEVADFETWDTEKKQYELKHLGWNAFAFMLKPDARGTEPPHWVCAHCFRDRRTAEVIQHTSVKRGEGIGFFCPSCHTEIRPSHDAFDAGRIKWID